MERAENRVRASSYEIRCLFEAVARCAYALCTRFRSEQAIDTILRTIAEYLTARHQRLAVAESCTGGLLAAACTERPGSSAWFDRGFITYANDAKIEMLGVEPALIQQHGAVSVPVVRAMLSGTLRHSMAGWAIAVSGVAGPAGGTVHKPVGTVYIGWAERGGAHVAEHFALSGDRAAVRRASVERALEGLVARFD